MTIDELTYEDLKDDDKFREGDLVTVPGDSRDEVDIANMVRLSKTYDNGNEVVLYAARYCNETTIRNSGNYRFFNHGHGSRPSYSYHRSGVVTGNTDRHACGGPVRRRAAYLLVWAVDHEGWIIWHLDSVTSVRAGKALIDHVLDTGELC